MPAPKGVVSTLSQMNSIKKAAKKSAAPPHKRVLDALRDGILTWDDLKGATKANDDSLGFTLGELLDLRKIWTAERNGFRIYGIERRTGLVARFFNTERRSTD